MSPFVVWGIVYWLQDVANNNSYDFDQMAHLPFYGAFLETGGAGYHLWFLTSLFVALTLLILGRRVLSLRYITFVSFALFLVGLAFRSYSPLIWDANPPLHFDTRNGVFFGFLFVTVGAVLKGTVQSMTLRTGLALLVFGSVLLCVEAAFLRIHSNSWILGHDFLLGTVPVGIGTFIVAVRLSYKNAFIASLGRVSLGLYAAHLFFLKMFIGFFPSGSMTSVAAYLALSLLSATASVMLLSQWQKTRFLVT